MWRIQRTQKTPNREKKQRNDGLHREGASKGDFPFVSARRPTHVCPFSISLTNVSAQPIDAKSRIDQQ